MKTSELRDPESNALTIEAVVSQIRLAASFLTILPLSIESASATDVAASMAWFPLVGFAMGVAFALEDYALSFFLRSAVRTAITVLSMAALSGAIHLDGLADTADALGAGRDRVRALQILRDSRIGTYGAVAVLFALALKIIALAGASGWPRVAALVLAPTLSRWSMVAVSYKLKYLREEGAGSAMLGSGRERNFTIASVIAIVAMLPLISFKIFVAYAVANGITLLLRSFYSQWLGGVTGDLIGACGEIVEVFAIVVLAS
jgi:adenosylcobinamide-GDP ribazoletransferase